MFQIGWVDYSREERNKIINIIKLLEGQDTIDELGIGAVRDVFSDFLFPGTSVLQTRAKYFVLVPYLFQMAQEKGIDDATKVAEYVRRHEEKLVEVLVKNSPGVDGIIGSRNFKSGKTVKMKPSSIYWNGLRATGILRYPSASIEAVCGQIASSASQHKEIQLKKDDKNKDVEQDDADALRFGPMIFTPIVPTYDVMKETKIALTLEEGEYLWRQFTSSPVTKDSLMAYMLRERRVVDTLFDISANSLDEPLKGQFILACEFAKFIYGAHLLYNIIFADGCGVNDERVEAEFARWKNDYKLPPLDDIIHVTKCSVDTAQFFIDFDSAIRTDDISRAKQIVIDRESNVKRGREKLKHPENASYKGPIHFFTLNYRYGTAKTIISDVLDSLKGKNV